MLTNPLLRCCLLLVLFIMGGCESDSERPTVTVVNHSGNEMNNILNGGYVTHQEDWIYYVEPDDNNYIYAKTNEGKHEQRLIKHQASSLNVIGEQLFYRNVSDKGRLYSASINGDKPVKLTEEDANLIYAEPTWLYFVDQQQRLCRMKHDGTEQERLTEIPVLHYFVKGDIIYFAEPFGKTIYKLELETRQLEQLVSVPHTILNARYTDNAVFYITDENKTIYQLSYQEPTPVQLIDNAEELYVVDEQFIYYLGEQMEKWNRNTNEHTVLEPAAVYYHMQVIPGRIFYMDHPAKESRHLIEILPD